MRDPIRSLFDEAVGPSTNGYHRPEPATLSRNAEGGVEVPQHIKTLPDVLVLRDAPEPPPRRYILDGLVPEGAATAIYGAGGVAKSLLAMSLAAGVARGEERWLGRAVEGCAALYLDFELTSDEQIRRAKSLCRGAGYGDVPGELYYASAVGFDSEAAFWAAYKTCADSGVGLVVVDSYGLAMQGDAVNNADVIGFYRRMLEPFIVDGIAVVLIDHQAKGGDRYQDRTLFGGVYKRNTIRSEIQIESLDQDEHAGTLDLVLRQSKNNFGPLQRPFGARLRFDADEIQVGPADLSPQRMAQEDGMKPTDRVLMALEYMDEEPHVRDVADYCDMQPRTAANALRSLERRGKVRTLPGSQRWAIVQRAPDFTKRVEPEPEIEEAMDF